jgi:branched-subunit amino acid transport protein AzlD
MTQKMIVIAAIVTAVAFTRIFPMLPMAVYADESETKTD